MILALLATGFFIHCSLNEASLQGKWLWWAARDLSDRVSRIQWAACSIQSLQCTRKMRFSAVQMCSLSRRRGGNRWNVWKIVMMWMRLPDQKTLLHFKPYVNSKSRTRSSAPPNTVGVIWFGEQNSKTPPPGELGNHDTPWRASFGEHDTNAKLSWQDGGGAQVVIENVLRMFCFNRPRWDGGSGWNASAAGRYTWARCTVQA